MELAASVGYDPSLREWMNQGRLWEYVTRNKAFVQSIQPLGEALTAKLGLERCPARSDRPTGIKSWVPVFNSR
ncbi:hypothetical protein D3C86_1931330 [compost metagenome]